MSKKTGIPVDELAVGGPGLSFIGKFGYYHTFTYFKEKSYKP